MPDTGTHALAVPCFTKELSVKQRIQCILLHRTNMTQEEIYNEGTITLEWLQKQPSKLIAELTADGHPLELEGRPGGLRELRDGEGCLWKWDGVWVRDCGMWCALHPTNFPRDARMEPGPTMRPGYKLGSFIARVPSFGFCMACASALLRKKKKRRTCQVLPVNQANLAKASSPGLAPAKSSYRGPRPESGLPPSAH